MSSVSSYAALLKLRFLLAKHEQRQFLLIACFALVVALFELMAATTIVVFVSTLNDPTIGNKYVSQFGLAEVFQSNNGILYMACISGGVFLIKNLLAGFEACYQNFTIQKMNCNFKTQLLRKYSAMEYSDYLQKNTSHGFSMINEHVETMFSAAITAFAFLFSELIIFLVLLSWIVYLNPSFFLFYQ